MKNPWEEIPLTDYESHMQEHALERAMLAIHYHTIKKLERTLPNGKKFVQAEFGGYNALPAYCNLPEGCV